MTDIIKECMDKNNIPLYGTARIEKSLLPFIGLEYAVSFCVPLSRAVVREIKEGPTKIYFHHYRTINAYIDRVSEELSLAITKAGYDAAYIPASQSVSESGLEGEFPHKTAAVTAGLGGIGKNALFVCGKYGPAVRLGTVFTDMPLNEGAKIQNPCTGCGRCVSACPSGALTGKKWETGIPREQLIDVSLCSHHMKNKYKHIGRGAVCGICISVCPLSDNRE